ncbi:MAG: hypothetical protein V4507_06360 [Verrucomicrobiota bacterium]
MKYRRLLKISFLGVLYAIAFFCLFTIDALQAKEETIYQLLDANTALADWSQKLGKIPMEIVTDPKDSKTKWVQVTDDSEKSNTAFAKPIDITGVKSVTVEFTAKMPEPKDPQVVILVFYNEKGEILNTPNGLWIDAKNRVQIKLDGEKFYTFKAAVPTGAEKCDIYIATYMKEMSQTWYRDFTITVEK